MADIHPIRSDTDYEKALTEINDLLQQNPDGDTPEAERLELLTLLVSDYESKHFPILPPDDPVAVIEFYMEKDGLTRKDLETYLGDKSRVSDILNRRRTLSLAMIRKLSQGLGIPADLLIGVEKRKLKGQTKGARVYTSP